MSETVRALLSSDLASAFITALVHSLWQGVALGLLLYLALRTIPASRTGLRYALCLLAMAALVLSIPATFAVMRTPQPEAASGFGSVLQAMPVSQAPAGAQPVAAVPAAPGNVSLSWTAWAGGTWFVGALLMLGRAVLLLSGATGLRRRSTALTEPMLLTAAEAAAQECGLAGRVRFFVTERLRAPAVVGALRPIVLLPASAVSGVPTEQLHLVLLHELAHVKRHDYLVNALQLVVEAVLFFNPAVWWISRQIRSEREACCDAAAAGAGGALEYARVLEMWASAAGRPARGVAPGAAGGSLLERVRRLLGQGHASPGLTRWHVSAAGMAAGAALLLVVWAGTAVGVQAAARVLSPAERAETMARLDATHGAAFSEDEGKVTVSGTLRAFDGAELPKENVILVECRIPGRSTVSSRSVDGRGRFSFELPAGSITLIARVPGYAPLVVGPLFRGPGTSIDGLDVVLESGFSYRLKFVDESGVGVPRVKVRGSYGLKATADLDGDAEFAHCSPVRTNFSAEAKGFQPWEGAATPQPGGSLQVVLLRARKATGMVVSAETGRPVPGAAVYLVRPALGPFDTLRHEPTTHSDGSGRFVLDSLSDGSVSMLIIKAPGLGTGVVREVRPGQEDLRVALGEPIHVAGKVVGNTQALRRDRSGKATVELSVDVWSADHAHHMISWSVPLEETPNGGTFSFDDVWVDGATLCAGDKRVDLDLTSSIDDLVVDLRDGRKKRPLVVRFELPDGTPPADGSCELTCYESGYARVTLRDVPVRSGVARVDVPVPSEVRLIHARVPGLWPDLPRAVRMEPGTEAAELVCEGLPAGGIFGRVLLRDGEPARDYSIDVLPVQKPEGLPAHGNLGNSSDWEGPDGRYNAAPLPLGGTYVVVLTRSRYTRLLSGPIALTPESPFHELDLQFPEGVAVRGQVLLPDGSPARGAPVTLRYRNAEYADGTNYQAGATDGSGLFRLDGVNPDAGSYTIEIGSNHSWQPYQGPARLDGRPMEVRLKKGLTVSGKVIDDASGLPIPGAKVMAGRSAVDAPPPLWREAEGPTDEAGAFRFSNLARGEYFLDVYGTTRAHGIAPVITAGQKDPVEVRVTIPAWSRLRPAPPGDATP